MNTILQLEHIQKYYGNEGAITKAIKDIGFSVKEGEFLGIMGASGSGKTTLLNCISTIDTVSAGHIYLEGNDITEIKPKALARFRRENLGFVFQDFNLLDNFSLKDNILLPLVLQRKPVAEMEERLTPIAERLGIAQLLEKYPYEVSGGQKQRTAVARAIITSPQLILADEPTGALDSKASAGLLHVFREINRDGQTILMVTHSTNAASHADRIMFIKDGEVFHQLYRGNLTNEQLYARISDTLTVLAQKAEGAQFPPECQFNRTDSGAGLQKADEMYVS